MRRLTEPATHRWVKRLVVDAIGNFIFFVPLVIALTPPLRSVDGATAYMLAAIPISILGARGYTLFLKHVWYPLCHESF